MLFSSKRNKKVLNQPVKTPCQRNQSGPYASPLSAGLSQSAGSLSHPRPSSLSSQSSSSTSSSEQTPKEPQEEEHVGQTKEPQEKEPPGQITFRNKEQRRKQASRGSNTGVAVLSTGLGEGSSSDQSTKGMHFGEDVSQLHQHLYISASTIAITMTFIV